MTVFSQFKKLSITATGAAIVLGLACATLPAEASPLRMDYTVNDTNDGWFQYDFKLTVDNHDNTYQLGQEWGWIIFGDKYPSPSPLTNWVGDLSKSSPWISQFTTTGGGHNGPTLAGPGRTVLANWIPSGVGDYLYWSGKSTANLAQGQLLFSTISSKGGVRANFEVANRVQSTTQSVPESSSVLGILAIGILGTGSVLKSKQQKAKVQA